MLLARRCGRQLPGAPPRRTAPASLPTPGRRFVPSAPAANGIAARIVPHQPNRVRRGYRSLACESRSPHPRRALLV